MSTEFTSDLGTFTVVHDACWFEIDGVPSSAGADEGVIAWDCPTPMGLLRPQPLRNGGGLMVPGTHGRLPKQRLRDSFETTLRFEVYDLCDPFGDTGGTPQERFVTNLLFLRENLGYTPGTFSTRTVTLYAPGGAIYTGTVQVEVDWPDDAAPPLTNVAVTVTVLEGLTEMGSA